MIYLHRYKKSVAKLDVFCLIVIAMGQTVLSYLKTTKNQSYLFWVCLRNLQSLKPCSRTIWPGVLKISVHVTIWNGSEEIALAAVSLILKYV